MGAVSAIISASLSLGALLMSQGLGATQEAGARMRGKDNPQFSTGFLESRKIVTPSL